MASLQPLFTWQEVGVPPALTDPDNLMALSNTIGMAWFTLAAFLPTWRVTRYLMRSMVFAVFPAYLYIILIVPYLHVFTNPAIDLNTTAGFAQIARIPGVAAAAWIHYIAFDHFVGRWIYFDAQQRKISAFLTAPCLFATLMLGPVGLFVYLALVRPLASSSKAGKMHVD